MNHIDSLLYEYNNLDRMISRISIYYLQLYLVDESFFLSRPISFLNTQFHIDMHDRFLTVLTLSPYCIAYVHR